MVKRIYIYLVLFATLMMVIGGSISTFSAIASIVAPEGYYMSYPEYVQVYHTNYGETKEVTKTKEELQEEYEMHIFREKELEKTRNINRLLQSLGWVLVPLPIFIFTSRHLKKKE
ncbi:hypothetical protein CV093_06045 [Oceanobacillus sp. 143]|uniref:Uncharacterized protein n=1 Tax=Oceanobacillus zhaokaii TaxID=2052660 RepID=A0A345PEL9_9BACI|nr:hypothetical protein [Oceanobacillus zhaokaii]AXI08449.1 hypothetical protein CUC15_05740 [Oceanobacillus zhaokaii]QGS68312.1 hypothetical protein CV093_06045 [Oceanobacillus sp. 143]